MAHESHHQNPPALPPGNAKTLPAHELSAQLTARVHAGVDIEIDQSAHKVIPTTNVGCGVSTTR